MAWPSISIVGAGNVARVLAPCLRRAGHEVREIISRNEPESRERATAIAQAAGARATTIEDSTLDADLIWLCVTDSVIVQTAKLLATRKVAWKGKVVSHTSGALTSDELSPLRKRGAKTASVHPMNTFIAGTAADLRGVPFALEGEKAAVEMLTGIARALNANGEVFTLKAKDKVLYHAIGSFSSPLFVALLAAGEDVGRAAGVKNPNAIRERILRNTLENYLRNGAPAAFSGPIRRGDVETVKRHLKALKKLPEAEKIYRALGAYAVRKLPTNETAKLKKLLRG